GVLLTASGRAFRHLRRSAGSRQGIVVSPGGAPTPPGCEGANLARGRRPSPRPGIAGRRLPDQGPVLRSHLWPAPRSRRLMSAPLSEQGKRIIIMPFALSTNYFLE